MSAYNMNNYESVRREFSWTRPANYNFVRDVFDHWAQQTPDKPALLWVDDNGNELTRSFADIAADSRKLCNLLERHDIQRGETVFVMLGRKPEWWITFTACLRMGAVFSPGTTQLSAKDIAYRINAAQVTCFITDMENAAKLEQIIGQCPTLKSRIVLGGERDGWIPYQHAMADAGTEYESPVTAINDDAMCYFTSGTTGHPKMCIHSHGYPMGHISTGKYWLDLQPDDLHWNISDTGWAKAAWSSYFGPWLAGVTIFIHHTAGFNARRTLELLQQYPVTTMCGAPTIYRMLVLEDLKQYHFKSLRHCVGAGEPLNPEVIDIWRDATGLTIRDGYGQTETGILCASFPPIEPRLGSMGKPAPGIDLQIIDDHGNILPPDTEGDIAVRVVPERPLGLFKEYRNNPEKTAAVFVGEWYITGDRARKDKDGYFWFISRADDVILSAGYRIGPFEVESALIEHPAVAESAVVSSPDETRGEVVKAFVVLAPGFVPGDELKKELQEHVKSITAPYKYPRKLEFIDALPKTVSGKIRRIELREREWSGKKSAG